MSLTEVMVVNKRGWKTARAENPISASGTIDALKTQFRVGGGVKGVVGVLAGMYACSAVANASMKVVIGNQYPNTKKILVTALTALVGGLVINRFAKDKTFGTMFSLGGLGIAGIYTMQALRLPFVPRISGLGTETGEGSQDINVFGLDADIAPFSPDPELLNQDYVGDRTVTTPFNDAGYEGLGQDEDIDIDTVVPTMTGL